MAEIEIASSKKKSKGLSKSRKLSTRIDLTPMVDLGFLLITFFIFTTSIVRPVAMQLNVPDDSPTKHPSEVSDEKTITFILGNGDNIFYYAGFFKGELTKIQFDQLRQIVIEKKKQVMNKFHTNDLTVLIKPGVESSYNNVINCLDEMIINDIKSYILDDPNKEELISLKSVKQ
jgi:biopolymer transport protein ExbD